MLSVGLKENEDQIKSIIDSYDFGKNITIKEEKIDNRLFLKFHPKDTEQFKKHDSFYNTLSLFITEIIIQYYLKDLILKEVFAGDNTFNREEKVEIVQLSYKNLSNEEKFSEERKLIFNEVHDYVSDNDIIIVDGFVNFRLKSMNKIIKGSIEEFSIVKEYREFINILQYFVNVQEPKMDLVNLVINDGEYKLYDESNNIINNDFFTDIIDELEEDGINKEDILISSLITIAPEKVIIHVEEEHKEDEIVDIIQKVFMKKAVFCESCELCNVKVGLNKEK